MTSYDRWFHLIANGRTAEIRRLVTRRCRPEGLGSRAGNFDGFECGFVEECTEGDLSGRFASPISEEGRNYEVDLPIEEIFW
jgi:hypothetical protein